MTHSQIIEPQNGEDGGRIKVPVWIWVVAAGVMLFFGVTLWQARKLQSELASVHDDFARTRTERSRLETQRQEMQRILAVMAAPDTRQVTLQGGATTPAVKAYWNEQQGVVLSAQKIPALATGRTLQLWVVPKKGNPVSAGVFQPDAAGNLLQLTRVEGAIGVKDAAALAISEEPAGGSAQPTTKAAWVGPVIQQRR